MVQAAVTALGIIGPAAKDAIPVLEKLTEHEDAQIAARAKAALRQVRVWVGAVSDLMGVNAQSSALW